MLFRIRHENYSWGGGEPRDGVALPAPSRGREKGASAPGSVGARPSVRWRVRRLRSCLVP